MAAYIANTICEAMEKVGSENVVHVVTNNVVVCKRVGQIIEDKYLILFIVATQPMALILFWRMLEAHLGQSYDVCQRTRNLLHTTMAKLITMLPTKPFMKWGLDFISPH